MPRLVATGLKDLAKTAKNAGDNIPRELGRANRDVATTVVRLTDRQRSRMRSRFRSYSGSVTKVKGSTSRTAVVVTVSPGAAELGAKRHPVFGRWLDQSTFKRQVWPTEKNRRMVRLGLDGYLVHPVIDDNKEEISGAYAERLSAFARREFGG